ncbi:MAG: HAMP domain-containing sensor histidine kinase [Eubacteriales bacterium]|nr:HAMP domain-containing sensor histidine kinase [Eubacteriales bacterium]
MKSSIKTQMVLVFASLVILISGMNLVINNLWLERYYIREKKSTMIEIFDKLNAIGDSADYQSDDFEQMIQEIQETDSVVLIILKATEDGAASIVYETSDDVLMRGRIEGYLRGFSITDDTSDVLKQTDRFRIQKFHDSVNHMDYLESYGVFENGCFFLMRLPIQSIRENVKISNQFSTYITLAGILLMVILVWRFSERITKPIRELTVISQKMADLDFGVRYQSGGKDEIGVLGKNFNQMSEKLEQTISELKTANNALQKDLKKKEEIDEMRKEFLSNVSHELKTPIALIQGYAEGLQEGIGDDPESREFYCDVIVDEAGKMNRLVQKLLTLNQLEFGTDVVNIERFNLTELISGVAQSSALLAEQKNAALVLRTIDADGNVREKNAKDAKAALTDLFVWGDEFKMEEVVTNYISNALNHVDGELCITVTEQVLDRKVRVLVHNTGELIPEEDLDKLWIKFYKVDKARTRAYGGSGVGLSIVKAIMDSHNQQYGVYNDGDGVTFWFELEVADA